ncbi:MAG: DUF2079 domain-containing protein [Anaerolineae bacterium]|nr:DUF2079 domain-containing protein [Anaerolineae bacterium]
MSQPEKETLKRQIGKEHQISRANESPTPSSSPRLPSTIYSLPNLLCLLLILTFAAFFSALAAQQHHTFQTNGLDLGNVDQALWNTAQGRFLHFTLMIPLQSRLALHVEPILLLFIPLYWLNLGNPETLLIIQAGVVAFGAWPLYQIAKNRFHLPHHNSPALFVAFLCLVFPLAYLLLPTLQAAVLYDFHAVTLAPTFLLFAFWALIRRQDKQVIIFLLLAMACKEDMPLVVAMVGVYAGLAQRRWRLAGLVIGLSALWFVTAVFVIQPSFSPGGNVQLDRYDWLGKSPVEMLQTLIFQPNLVLNHLWSQANLPGYLWQLFLPTAFLAFFSPLTLLPMLPTLAINLLSQNPFTWRLEDFHYGAPLAPFLFISAIYGIKRVGELAQQSFFSFSTNSSRLLSAVYRLPYLLIMLLFSFTIAYHYYRGFTPLARPFNWPQATTHHRQLEAILTTIPPDTSLFTQSNLAPHLTHRFIIYSDFGYFTDPNFPAPTPVDDILLDVTTFENFGGLHQFMHQTLLESGAYQLKTARDGILHWQPLTKDQRPTTNQGAPGSPFLLPPSFFTFTRPDFPPRYSLPVDFGHVIRLHGYTLSFNRQEEVQVSVDLEPLQVLSGNIQPVLYLLDPMGRPIGTTTDRQPLLVWYPPDQWPVGEVVRVNFNTLPWYTRETEKYGLALGIISGDEVWDINHRHHPVIIHPSKFAVRLLANGTLVELARIQQVGGMPEGGPGMRQYVVPRMSHSLAANFDNQLKLLGHTTPKITETENTQSLNLSLYWQAVRTPETLTRFVQLVGPDGQLYGQNDTAPDNGHYPTHLWQPGEVVEETVTFSIQTERPAGNYTLHVGLYRPDTGQRLPLVSGGDHVEILLSK